MKSARTLKVWIAGASGFCGRGITEALAPHSRFHVMPHIRPSSRRAARLRDEWAALKVDLILEEWATVDETLSEQQPNVIVSCLGTTKRHAKSGGGSYEEVDYGLNRKLIDVAETFERPPHFIYLSSMGTEWGRWNSYLNARMRIEGDLEASKLSYSIIRPGLLSGPSRDEKRSLEGVGTWLSFSISGLYQRLGLQRLSDKTRPLDAPEVGIFVRHLIDRYASGARDLTHRELYLVHQIHETLRRTLTDESA